MQKILPVNIRIIFGGNHMEESLEQLLKTNESLKQYFSGLPGYIQENIQSRAQSIQSAEDLYRYADNLLNNL